MPKRIQGLTAVGDTIVEVLLAIAVISAVLGGAYASASQSSRGLRQSQERGEALKLLEAQIELLKSAKANGHSPQPNPFCVVQGSQRIEFKPAGPDEAACHQGTDGRYQLSLQRGQPREYTATAAWDSVGGGAEQERVTIVYRVETQ